MEENKIIVLDFGSQVTHLLARRIRQLGVYSKILPPTTSLNELRKAKGIILSGGPSSVYDRKAPKYNKELFKLKKPMLGLCYGHQLMMHALGGKVEEGKTKEYGKAVMKVLDKNNLLKELKQKETIWMSHGDTVYKIPEGFKAIGSTKDCEFAAVGNEKEKKFGFQFHPEVTHTAHGLKMLENFIEICRCKKNWSMKNFVKEKIKEIKKEVEKKNVFLLVSGGVDSLVCLALLNKVLGKKRVYALHIDNGFMRKNESKEVEEELKKLNLSELHVFDAEIDFLEYLDNITDAEKKRNRIGKLFLKIADNKLKELQLDPKKWLLGQGTIYPDTIESQGTEHASKIKTHHNRIESIQELIDQGRIIEPLKELYKDEVRELGLELGLKENLVFRHPFPGPGLAIRCLCAGEKDLKEEVKHKLGNWNKEVEKKADKLLRGTRLKSRLLPVKSVGVQGDARTFRHPIVLMGTGNWKKLEKASTTLTNSLNEINRCVWLLHPKKIERIDLIKNDLSKQRLDLLREADAVVNNVLRKHNLMKKIWQFPVICLPLKINGKDGEAIVLRPVFSLEAMTAKFATIDKKVLKEIVEGLKELEGVNAVFYDVTHKPPGTICWE